MSERTVPIHEHPTWRKHRPLVPLPESFIKAQQALGLKAAGFPKAFWLRRYRGGTLVWLVFTSGLRIEVADLPGQQFHHARRWCATFAHQHGFTPMELLSRSQVAKRTAEASR